MYLVMVMDYKKARYYKNKRTVIAVAIIALFRMVQLQKKLINSSHSLDRPICSLHSNTSTHAIPHSIKRPMDPTISSMIH